jgi:putative Mg2+ transporter-C (MgtC) family protein
MAYLEDWLNVAWTLHLGFGDAVFRLGAALLCGAVIGIDRERRNRSAGLRTHMLVALAAALFTIISFQIYAEVQTVGENNSTDPLRLLEAITAGVAFLAAGSIFRQADGVEGLTTGSGLWLCGALGMACGRGYFLLALLGVALAFTVLAVLRFVSRQVKD